MHNKIKNYPIFKNINESINIEYEDIICSLYLILLKLKERKIKKP